MEAGHLLLACLMMEQQPPQQAPASAAGFSITLTTVDSKACKAHFVDQKGKLVAECSSRMQTMHYPGHHNFTLLSCLHNLSMDGHLQLSPVSYQSVPSTAYNDDIQQQQELAQHWRWRGSETLAALEACQGRGVVLVKVLVRLMPTFFCTPQLAAAAAADVESADEQTCAHGLHVVQLLKHLSSPLQQCKYLTATADINSCVDVTGISAGAGQSVSNPEQQQVAYEAAQGDAWVPTDRATSGGHLVHDEVFEIVRPRGWSTELPDPPGLKCQLYRYQRRALAWMAWREQLGLHLHDSDMDAALEQVKPASAAADPAASGTAGCSPGGKPSKGASATALGKRGSTPGAKAARSGKRRKVATDGEALADEAAPAADLPPVNEEDAAAARKYMQLVRAVQPPAAWPDDGRQRLLWASCRLQSGQVVWLNKEYHSGLVSLTLPPPDLPPLRGGLLCDEMGLGKTVEVIALILARPRSLHQPVLDQPQPQTVQEHKEQLQEVQGHDGEHSDSTAPQWTVQALQPKQRRNWIETAFLVAEAEPEPPQILQRVNLRGATLIITPPTILQQWVGELRTHSNLKVGIYEGLKQAYSSMHDALSRQARMAEQEARRCEKRAAKCEQELLKLHQQYPELAQLPHDTKDGGKATRGKQGSKKRKAAAAAVEEGDEAQGLAQATREQERLRRLQTTAQEAAREAVEAASVAHRELAALLQDQVAVDEATRLAGCDVVLTTYATLSAEVNYVEQNIERKLRHNKRYPVPDSPLLQVSWHRLVLDEAQMVGTGLTSVAVMANRLSAQHRWCVTGTPMGAGGLQDIFGEICSLQFGPLDDPGVFKRVVVEPYLSGSQDGYRRLQLLLKPIMWRNSKAIAAADLSLPPRTLRHALLAMSTPERTFYEHIVSEARKANEAWKAHQGDDAQQQATHQHGRHHKPQQERDMLARKAAQQLTQLRLACVHPQLTEYWRQLSTQLQLGQAEGGALSVNEMLSHMCEQAQLELQNEEREYCQAADCLAEKLLRQAERLDPKAPSMEAGDVVGETASKGSKRKKQKKQPAAASATSSQQAQQQQQQRNGQPAEDGGTVEDDERAALEGIEGATSPGMQAKKIREECLVLLESSWRVGEKGIDAASGEAAHVFEELDNISAANASWRAWRMVQIRTCHMLAELYDVMGRPDDAAKLHQEVSDKEGDLKERVETAIAKAETQLASLQQRADAIQQQQLAEAWQAADAAEFPVASFLPARLQPQEWLATTFMKWQQAREVEAAQRQQEANAQEVLTVLLGTEVSHLLSTEEASIQAVLRQVDGLLGSQLCSEAHERVKAALQVLDHHARQQALQKQQAPAGEVGDVASVAVTEPSAVASALWAACRGVDKAVAWQCAVRLGSKAQALQHVSTLLQEWLLAGNGDMVGLTTLRRALNLASNKLKERALIFEGQLDGEGRTARLLRNCSHAALGKALDALKMQVELLRVWRELHVESLKVEVETSNRDLIREEVMAAMQGESIRGLTPKYSRMPVGQLRVKCEALRKQCEELRARKAYLQHQMLEAAGGNAGQAAHQPSSSDAPKPPQQQQQQQQQQPQQQQQQQEQEQQASKGVQDAGGPTRPTSQSASADVRATATPAGTDLVPVANPIASPSRGAREPSPAIAQQIGQVNYAGLLHSGIRRQTGISSVLNAWPTQYGAQSRAQIPSFARAGVLWPVKEELKQAPKLHSPLRDVEMLDAPSHPGPVKADDSCAAATAKADGSHAAAPAGPSQGDALKQHDMATPHTTPLNGKIKSAAQVLPGNNGIAAGGPSARQTAAQATIECIDLLGTPSDSPSAPLAAAPTDVIDLTLDDEATPARPQPPAAVARSIKIRIKTPNRPERPQEGQTQLQVQQNGQQQGPAAYAQADAGMALHQAGLVGAAPQGDGEEAAKAAQECPICFNALAPGDPLMVYPCGHYFCKECSDTLLAEHKPRCPTCRRELTRNQVFRVVAGGGNTGLRHNPEIDPPEGLRVAAIKVVGVWMTKLEALLRRLLLLRSTAPDEKALVFSHFPSALELVSKALTVNDIGHVSVGMKSAKRATSRDAVARFNTDPEVPVFLLSLHHGAAGLTLVRANHVFMLDISTDPAIEQQAVARVHRIGQQRNVTITRLLCDGTVEMQIKQALQHKQQVFMERASHHVHVEGEDDAADHAHLYDHEQGHMDLDSPGMQQPGTSIQHAAARGNGAGLAQSEHEHLGPLPNGAAEGAGVQLGGVGNDLPEEDPESALLAQGAIVGGKEEMQLDEAAQLLSQL